ncbi:MAG: type 1 periplasmic-binding domain-containing protein, partial [Acidimicrobiales bacterium]
KVFALIDNNSLTTAPSAHFEYTSGVPDLGLPLNNGYYKYPNFFTLYGIPYPRDGTQVGVNGKGYNTTEVYRYYKQVTGVSKGAFFFYNQASSQTAARLEEAQAVAEGICKCYESGGSQGEQIGAANWDADVLAMKDKHIDGIFDAVDVSANQKICASMDRYGVSVKVKASTIEVWSQDIGSGGWSSPCRNSVYVTGSTVPFMDTKVPVMAQFRRDFSTYSPGALLHQWAVDGYAGGVMFSDAIASMGATPTRKGMIAFFDGIKPYTYSVHGLYHDVDWVNKPHPNTRPACGSVAQWQDSAGTFVTRSGGGQEFYCYTTTEIAFPYTDDGS